MLGRLKQTHYLLSAHHLHQLPEDGGREIAFVGRSNAGKSSVLNALTHRKALARVSKTPGRTQQLNYFQVQADCFLVDFPGYGYAQVPRQLRQHWQKLIADYFSERQALQGVVVVMDVRHPLKEYDKQMLAFAASRQLPAHILLTKADKLSRNQQLRTLSQVKEMLVDMAFPMAQVQLFSAITGLGLEGILAVIARWFDWAESLKS